MEKIILTNMCLIENKTTKEVVVIHRIKDWCGIAFPGGHVEEGEAIVPSVIREVKEETGLDVNHLEFCGIRDWYDPTTQERNIVFMFKTSSFSGTLYSNHKEGVVEWRRLDSIQQEEYASGLDLEMGIFFEQEILEFYSHYDTEQKKWNLIQYGGEKK
ncbi:MAG: 8-oxo-dGTP diphosphatase [Anaeroplasma bactoclasticum]|nr:8-oxo-dGTP diphosphatase [Anaeroplasma bactoclasticum]